MTTSGPRILVAEDEENLAFLLGLALQRSSFEVDIVGTGAEALARSRTAPRPDMLVLDVMLPDIDGFRICQRVRADNNDVPVLFLTARDAPADRLHGLTIGGDDYLTKPFSVDELIARVRVILRRVGRPAAVQVIQRGDLRIDDDAHTVTRGDDLVSLSPMEYKVLRFLARDPGRVISRIQILDHVWNYDFVGESSVVETHISSLRKKLGSDGRELIQTVRGYGYRFRKS